MVLASKPHVLPPSADRAAAVVWAANPGCWAARAIAELLFGEIEPSGRLPISWPRHVGQQPTYYNQIDAQHGHRYADLTQEPAWVFGDGLGYSTVEYRDLEILTPSLTAPRQCARGSQWRTREAAKRSRRCRSMFET